MLKEYGGLEQAANLIRSFLLENECVLTAEERSELEALAFFVEATSNDLQDKYPD